MSTDPTVAYQNSEPYYGCPALDKSNAVVVAGGSPSTIVYQVRDANGTPVDLSGFFPDGYDPDTDPTNKDSENYNPDLDPTNPDGPAYDPDYVPADIYGIYLKFTIADNTAVANKTVRAYPVDAKQGKIQFEIPDYVYNIPCIYAFYVSVGNARTFESDGKAKWVSPQRGVLLIEWSPFMQHLDHCPIRHRVVPSIEDVRRKLDDFAGKNDLLNQVEFTADDIINAMIRPVHIFNETPPRLRRFTFNLSTFPYYDMWVIGTAAELLQIAVIHYVRNKLQSNHGGIAGDEKNRDRDYMQLAQLYAQQYKEWVKSKKIELNYSAGQGWGTIHSEYGRMG